MPAIEIPAPLPLAITPDREVVEFLVHRHLQEFGEDSLVARTWQWVLYGGGRGPISHMDYTPVRPLRPALTRHPRRRKPRQ